MLILYFLRVLFAKVSHLLVIYHGNKEVPPSEETKLVGGGELSLLCGHTSLVLDCSLICGFHSVSYVELVKSIVIPSGKLGTAYIRRL